MYSPYSDDELYPPKPKRGLPSFHDDEPPGEGRMGFCAGVLVSILVGLVAVSIFLILSGETLITRLLDGESTDNGTQIALVRTVEHVNTLLADLTRTTTPPALPPTLTPTFTASPTRFPSHTAPPTGLPSPTWTASVSPTRRPSQTVTPSPTPSRTITPSITVTASVTASDTPTATPTASATITATPTATLTGFEFYARQRGFPRIVGIDHLACRPRSTDLRLIFDQQQEPNFYYYEVTLEVRGTDAAIIDLIPLPLPGSDPTQQQIHSVLVTIGETSFPLANISLAQAITGIEENWARLAGQTVRTFGITWFDTEQQPDLMFDIRTTHIDGGVFMNVIWAELATDPASGDGDGMFRVCP